jgi:hypothetical protein
MKSQIHIDKKWIRNLVCSGKKINKFTS